MKTFTFHTDPGHGWLEVTVADIADLGLTRKDFSSYSYTMRGILYLEEDCDAPVFIKAFKAKHGEDAFRTVEEHKEVTPIRSYPALV